MIIVTRMFARLITGQKRMRNTQLALLAPKPGAVLFLGDSITEQGMWHEWFPEASVVNRGVGGERTDELLDRLDSTVNSPSAVLLLIGTNDVTYGKSDDEIVDDLERVIEGIAARAPSAPIVLQSVMPRTRKLADRLKTLNARYREVASRHSIECLDLWPTLATREGELNLDFTADRLHLTGAGYAAWVEVLRPYVDRYSFRS